MQINKIRVALKTGGSTLVNMVNYKKDGSEFRNNLAFFPLPNVDGKLAYFIGIQNCPTSVYVLHFEAMYKFGASAEALDQGVRPCKKARHGAPPASSPTAEC